MTAPSSLVTTDDMHAHLVDQLNSALRRPGMYGGETTLLLLVGHLLFMERRPQAWDEHRRLLEEHGAWCPTGVTGVFRHLFPDESDGHGAASVYAEFAFQHGWLRPDHLLDTRAYDALSNRVRRWAQADRVWTDVVEEFGTPSVLLGGSNPFYGKTLGYLTKDPNTPMVFFHLWNGAEPGTGPSWPPSRPEPALLAVRFGEEPFSTAFTFTPEGHRLNPTPPENNQRG